MTVYPKWSYDFAVIWCPWLITYFKAPGYRDVEYSRSYIRSINLLLYECPLICGSVINEWQIILKSYIPTYMWVETNNLVVFLACNSDDKNLYINKNNNNRECIMFLMFPLATITNLAFSMISVAIITEDTMWLTLILWVMQSGVNLTMMSFQDVPRRKLSRVVLVDVMTIISLEGIRPMRTFQFCNFIYADVTVNVFHVNVVIVSWINFN